MAPCDITSQDELHRLPNFLSLVFCRFLRRETDNVLYVYAYSALILWTGNRLCVTSFYCIEMTEGIELVFGMEASFHLSHCVSSGN